MLIAAAPPPTSIYAFSLQLFTSPTSYVVPLYSIAPIFVAHLGWRRASVSDSPRSHVIIIYSFICVYKSVSKVKKQTKNSDPILLAILLVFDKLSAFCYLLKYNRVTREFTKPKVYSKLIVIYY